MFEGCPGGQPSLGYMVFDCPMLKRAVANNGISFYRLEAATQTTLQIPQA